MKRDNRGVTLVELLVALAILGILSAAVMGFVSAGSSSYQNVSASIDIQMESQLTVNQIQQYLVDCNGGVSFEGDSLFILNREDSGSYVVHAFQYREEALYYSCNEVTDEGGTFSCTIADGDKLSGHILAFQAATGAAGTTTSVMLDISFYNSGKTYRTEQTSAMRNPVYSAVSLETLLSEVCK